MKLSSRRRVSLTRTKVQTYNTDHRQTRPALSNYLLLTPLSPLHFFCLVSLSSLGLTFSCLSSVSDLSLGVLVYGGKNRNRAVHGDVVVVELLPKSEWRGKVTALTEGQGEEKSGEENESKPMPTGGTIQSD